MRISDWSSDVCSSDLTCADQQMYKAVSDVHQAISQRAGNPERRLSHDELQETNNMSLSEEVKRHIDKAATESLEMMDQVAKIAARQSTNEGLSVSSLETINTLNTAKEIGRAHV